MDVTSLVRRAIDVRASADAVYALLADIPRSVAHFPDVESVLPEGDAWVWRLRRLGAGPLQFQVVYGSRYAFDPATRDVRWSPVAGIGNTRVEGRWIIEPLGAGARFTLDASFTLTTPFPRLVRGAVEQIVQHENARLIGTYMENLRRTLEEVDR